MKEVITKFLLIIVSVAAVVGFVYGTLWTDTQDVRNDTHTQIQNANPPAAGSPS